MAKKQSHGVRGLPAKFAPTVTETIDLHGYRRYEGIKTLTSFMDQVVSRQRNKRKHGDIWVLVITGSGAHSPEGPVLRNAVQTLLEKRQMKFTLNQGRGSFTVKANSGIVFFEPGTPVDTKLILKDVPKELPSIPRPKANVGSHSAVALDDGEEAPTPHEVASFDNVIEESRKDHQEYYREQKKGEKLIQRALSVSRLEAQQEEEEQEHLQRALSMSILDSTPNQHELDDDLQKALELSKSDFQHCPDESEEFQRALQLSQQVSSKADDELFHVLELSKKEYEYTKPCPGALDSVDDDQAAEFSQENEYSSGLGKSRGDCQYNSMH